MNSLLVEVEYHKINDPVCEIFGSKMNEAGEEKAYDELIYSLARFHYTVKHQPSLACTKCNNSFQAEPDQYEKTNAFMEFLKSIGLQKAGIEYKDMIRYVDEVMKFQSDDE